MTEVHYGVVRVEDHWSIVGEHLRFGRYASQALASKAAARLAEQSTGVGMSVLLAVQHEDFTLPAPTRLG
ncbi:hypothetical protein [Caulobacter henricii]|uniref:DUF2188 domain-containing protein n=1 Tax=Caulobacter henricii TaxID=69395 RepID=A0A0P0NVX9_9CAUL|nr:hypothetical protein [Caulobacter henricii]ALL12123.1 hypothetical protein AQ619_01415 [Caulobacter henricii]